MPKRKTSAKKPPVAAYEDMSGHMIWASVTIISLPVAALSFSAMGFHPVAAFGLGALITLAIILIETLIRGRSWFLNERFMGIFGHKDTAFRLIIVTGGVLLLVQSFLLIEMIRNPDMDIVLFNMIVQKQCSGKRGALSDLICPLIRHVSPAEMNALPLLYSMEQAAKSHLIPNSLFGACAVWPYDTSTGSADRLHARFAAYCIPWSRPQATSADIRPVIKIIQSEFIEDQEGFYQPTVWMEDDDSRDYINLLEDTSLINYLNEVLIKRHSILLRSYTGY